MASFIKKIFGDANARETKRLEKQVAEVNALASWASALTEEDFPRETARLRERLVTGEDLDELMAPAFALAREAAERVTGLRPFDVQLLGAIVLHQGRIAEMKTGEGKTLVAVLPAYLNALDGKGVHIVTVNDYLARRDSEWMGPVFNYLGLTVGLIVQGLNQEERRRSYAADITYATNNELGFDYLRDNMVIYKEDLVQRDLNYAIVDEVDSILIDEARTPLIISGRVDTREDYGRWKREVEHLIRRQNRLVSEWLTEARRDLDAGSSDEAAYKLLLARRGAPKNRTLMKLMKEPGLERLVDRTRQQLMTEKRLNQLDEELFYHVDEASRTADIKDRGYRELEKLNPELVRLLQLGGSAPDDLEDEMPQQAEDAGEHRHYFDQMIKAYSLFERDVDYVVQEGRVVIVDTFTGRLMPGRRYSDGLHQAIEAKEGVEVQAATRTVASITFQNYFRMYAKISGMTGTALTEEEEFLKIYGMDVLPVNTHRPMIRQDRNDLIYKTERAKFQAAVEEIAALQENGQPVLVGTVSVEKSEMLSKMLQRRGITHEVLNAVNHGREAFIIAQAGRRGAVTISTNMAGRGTDIILGGNADFLVREKLEQEFALPEGELGEEERERYRERHALLLEEMSKDTLHQREDVLALGGLHVLGTERHESRRIDNQLRGRSGRQGDPGSSQFFVSLEDDLMRLFGGDNIASLMERFGMEEDVPIDHPLVSRGIENAQKKVESRNFEIRRNLLNYDDVLNKQREVVYSQRRRVLENEDLREPVLDMVREVIEELMKEFVMEEGFVDDHGAVSLHSRMEALLGPAYSLTPEDLGDEEASDVRDRLTAEALNRYEAREKELTLPVMRELERVVLLRTVDRHWTAFLNEMQELRREIHTQAYAQRDPLVEYRRQSFDMFEDMNRQVRSDVVRALYQVRVTTAPRRSQLTGEARGYQPRIAPVGSGPGRAAAASSSQRGRAAQERTPGEGPPAPVSVEKIGRNAPCPCGSGKKYKKCCGA